MAQVTSGLVSVEDGIKKPEEYSVPRKVRVELSFSVGEDEAFETIFDHVSQAASNRVAALLNGTALRVVTPAATPAIEQRVAEPEAPKTRVRRTKAQIAADEAIAAAKASGEELPDDPTGGEEHVIQLPDESGEELPDEPTKDGPTILGDDETLEDEFTVQPEPEAETTKAITDADLNAAVQRKNGELQAPDLIRKLIAEYNPDPKQVFQLRQIEQERRSEFLAKLSGLKKAG